MKIKVSEISVFFPFWNEESNIEEVVAKAVPVLKSLAQKWEIIMIDDGSSDSTLSIAKKIAKSDPVHLRIISHMPNRGYGASLKDGFEHARYNLVAFTDGDGQFDIRELGKFLDLIGPVDIVIGIRKKRLDHPFRHLLMNLLKIWDYLLFGFYFQDIDCGFKLFKRSALNKILPLKSEGAMITTEILAKAIKNKLQILQVKVSHYPRRFGNQSGGNPRVIIRAIKESLVLWWDLYYGRN